MRAPINNLRERGAALLAAMLTVTLVATFAAAAMWQQWRAAEVEAAERTRIQSAWVLIGALDWARIFLREDGRTGGPDHLGEEWAHPLEEARLSSFLAADKNIASDALEGLPDAFMSGRIIDAQSKLNVTNLVVNGKPEPAAVAAFTKLFELISVPTQELSVLVLNLQKASAGLTPAADQTGAAKPAGDTSASASDYASAPLLPQQVAQLTWLGLSPSTVTAIEPYVTILPVSTPININTASAEVLSASVPNLDLASAKRLVTQRTNQFFKAPADAQKFVPESTAQFNDQQHSVSTRFFEVHGRLRLDKIWVEEHSLVQRVSITTTVLWRNRGVGATFAQVKP